MKKIVIQLICKDQKGIIAQITSIIFELNINILSIEQHVDNESNKFYIRILSELNLKNSILISLKTQMATLNEKLKGKINFYDPDKKINVAILGTKETEPIYDILIKRESGDISCNPPIILSNHSSLKPVANQFNLKFKKINNNKDLFKILKNEKIDLIILARYMQIIPSSIVNEYKNKIINIHHGFLPAFKGANPYRQAFNKGVKVIGATSHYITNKLDEGPIISQNIIHINHKHTLQDMIKLGREIEKSVLSIAVKAHLEQRIIICNNKTIIFK